MRNMRRLALTVAIAAATSVGVTTPALAIASVQLYSFAMTPTASGAPSSPSAKIGTGTGRIQGLGLDEDLAVQIFNAPGGPTLLVTGESPLIVREIVPGTLTAVANDPNYGSRLSFAFPAILLNVAPGVIAALTDLNLSFPAQFADSGGQVVPLFGATGCNPSWRAQFVGTYTTTFSGLPESTQTIDVAQPCPPTPAGPVSLSLNPYFNDISGDLNNQVQFGMLTADFYLPREAVTNLGAFPTCTSEAIFADETQCTGYTLGPAGPAGPAAPGGTTGGGGSGGTPAGGSLPVPTPPLATATRLTPPAPALRATNGKVKVTCAAASGALTSCRATLSVRGKVIGSAGGTGRQLTLKLNSAGKKLLRKARGKKLTVTLKLVAQTATGPVTLTKTVKIKA